MVDPKYNIKRIPKDILMFLKYTQSGHMTDDPIPFAMV